MRLPTTLTALTAALLLLTACGGSADDDAIDLPADETPDDADDPEGDETTDDASGPSNDDPAAGSDPLLGPEIQVAMDDLVERTGVVREDIQILVTDLVTWPDGAIGCPEPDVMYTQALVEGYRIVLEADGTEYAYHGATGADPGYCADPDAPAS